MVEVGFARGEDEGPRVGIWGQASNAENAWDDRKVLWGSVAALHTMAARA